MMYFNSNGKGTITYDAIIVGSGISGGWAAKELCEKGLKTLVLERGRMVAHPDYPTANLDIWDLPHRDRLTRSELSNYPVQRRTNYTLTQASRHWWVNDLENPYTEIQRFDWIRGYHVGGRSLMWGRQSYRWSPMDFEANAKEGIAIDWPIRYEDLAPWYDHVEAFVGISGRSEGFAQLPDGVFLPPMELNCVENYFGERLKEKFNDRRLTIGRVANLTVPHLGRGQCVNRNRCIRGCPYGAYFSSQAATLPAAEATGNMTLRPNSIVHTILFDDNSQKATGVLVLDAETRTMHEFRAKVIFLCASTLGSTWILMHSISARFPNGMGNDSGELGSNLMDHHQLAGASGAIDGFTDKYYKGRKPNGIYIPRFRNLDKSTQHKDFLRGYGYQGGAGRNGWWRVIAEVGFGSEMKEKAMEPGQWRMGLTAFGEMLPDHTNHARMNYDRVDKYGLPTLTIDCGFGANEWAMRKDMKSSAGEMLEACGFKNIDEYMHITAPGRSIHEMGTARMGRDPKTSVLNAHNQIHAVKNVFVTDGACMTSAACQNPSLTYMAITARAADYALTALNRNEL